MPLPIEPEESQVRTHLLTHADRHQRTEPGSLNWGRQEILPQILATAPHDCMVNAVSHPRVGATPPQQIRALQTLTSWGEGELAPESGRYWFWVAADDVGGIPYTKVTFGSIPGVVNVVEMRERLLDLERLCVALAHDEPYELAGLGVVR